MSNSKFLQGITLFQAISASMVDTPPREIHLLLQKTLKESNINSMELEKTRKLIKTRI